MSYETILVEKKGAVTLVTLNRPQALNALNSTVLKELIDAFGAYDSDQSQHCLVLTGSEKAFAAGADIKEMQSQGFSDMANCSCSSSKRAWSPPERSPISGPMPQHKKRTRRRAESGRPWEDSRLAAHSQAASVAESSGP